MKKLVFLVLIILVSCGTSSIKETHTEGITFEDDPALKFMHESMKTSNLNDNVRTVEEENIAQKRIQLAYGWLGYLPCSNNYSHNGYEPYPKNCDIYYKQDEFTKITFYVSKTYFDVSTNHPLEVYIGVNPKSGKYLILKFQYRGESWIFFDYIILIDNFGNKIEWNLSFFNVERDTVYKGVVETYQQTQYNKNVSKLVSILNNKNVTSIKIRLVGKYRQDYELSRYDIEDLQNMCVFYKKLK